MRNVISIDLGSTNSAVCVLEGGKPVVVVNEEGGQTTPSIINLKDGTPKVGGVAKRQMVTCPKETVNLIKRFMGGTYSDVKDAISHVQYDVVDSHTMGRLVAVSSTLRSSGGKLLDGSRLQLKRTINNTAMKTSRFIDILQAINNLMLSITYN